MKVKEDCKLSAIVHKPADCKNTSYLFDSRGRVVCEFFKKLEDNGEVRYITKATSDYLIEALLDDFQDKNYVEDFLISKDLFGVEPSYLLHNMISWCEKDHQLIDKVCHVLMIWIRNHFIDFRFDYSMKQLLLNFLQVIECQGMLFRRNQIAQLCTEKSCERSVNINCTASSQGSCDSPGFEIIVRNCGRRSGGDYLVELYIGEVWPDSLAEKQGLIFGDQILKVNNVTTFCRSNKNELLNALRNSTSNLELIVKWNLVGLDDAFRQSLSLNRRISSIRHCRSFNMKPLVTAVDRVRDSEVVRQSPQKDIVQKLGRVFKKLRNGHKEFELSESSDCPAKWRQLRPSRSNPDLAVNSVKSAWTGSAKFSATRSLRAVDFILKVYKSDQTFRYLPVFEETTAQNVVQLALQEFYLASGEKSSLDWALYEVTCREDGTLVQKRLADNTNNLHGRLELNSRYYLKNLKCSDQLISDEQSRTLLNESVVEFLHFNTDLLAAYLAKLDHKMLSEIEASDYVNDLLDLPAPLSFSNVDDSGCYCSMSGYTAESTKAKVESSRQKINAFERTVNQETWWVAFEVLKETSDVKRAKILKKFIKLAAKCLELQNFSSMFAVISGLEKPSVKRLQSAWDRVPLNYQQLLQDLQMNILDPTRNMTKYRTFLCQAAQHPPVLPLFPLFRKDLYFLNEHNKTFVDGSAFGNCKHSDGTDNGGTLLVNFDKMRMLAKEIRFIRRMVSAQYDLDETGLDALGSYFDSCKSTLSSYYASWSSPTNFKDRQSILVMKKRYDLARMRKKCHVYLTGLRNMDMSTFDCLDYTSTAHSVKQRNLLTNYKVQCADTISTNSQESSGSFGSEKLRDSDSSILSTLSQKFYASKIHAATNPSPARSDSQNTGSNNSPSVSSLEGDFRPQSNQSNFDSAFIRRLIRPKPLLFDISEGDLDLFDQISRI